MPASRQGSRRPHRNLCGSGDVASSAPALSCRPPALAVDRGAGNEVTESHSATALWLRRWAARHVARLGSCHLGVGGVLRPLFRARPRLRPPGRPALPPIPIPMPVRRSIACRWPPPTRRRSRTGAHLGAGRAASSPPSSRATRPAGRRVFASNLANPQLNAADRLIWFSSSCSRLACLRRTPKARRPGLHRPQGCRAEGSRRREQARKATLIAPFWLRQTLAIGWPRVRRRLAGDGIVTKTPWSCSGFAPLLVEASFATVIETFAAQGQLNSINRVGVLSRSQSGPSALLSRRYRIHRDRCARSNGSPELAGRDRYKRQGKSCAR